MHHHVSIVEHDPAALFVALCPTFAILEVLPDNLLDLVGHRMHLPAAGAGGDHEVVDHRRERTKVEDPDLSSPRLAGHAGGQQGQRQRTVGHGRL